MSVPVRYNWSTVAPFRHTVFRSRLVGVVEPSHVLETNLDATSFALITTLARLSMGPARRHLGYLGAYNPCNQSARDLTQREKCPSAGK